ncbi:carbonic anhydrase [Xylogone sp. PMI_703]|nr:carbonic anhydrase [Xylogone sp. PMI_703]
MAKQTLGRADAVPYRPYDFAGANKEFQKTYKPNEQDLQRGCRSRTAIITCIDARSTPEHFFELKQNEAWSIRNGGGRTNDPGIIRSLALLQVMTDLKEVKVIHHSNCGSLFYTDEWVRDVIAKNEPNGPNGESGPYGEGAGAYAETMSTLPFHFVDSDESERERIEKSIREDVQFLRDHPLIKPAVSVTGWYYNLHNGRVEEVAC